MDNVVREKTDLEQFYEIRIEAMQKEIERLNKALVSTTSQLHYLQFSATKAMENADDIKLSDPDFIISIEKLIKNFLD